CRCFSRRHRFSALAVQFLLGAHLAVATAVVATVRAVKGEAEPAADAVGRLQRHPPAVRFDDLLGDCQAQSRAGAAGLTGHAEESLENALDVLPRDAGPAVF